MRNVGLFIDTSNLYGAVRRKFSSRKIDYKAYIAAAEDIGTLVVRKAYGVQAARQASAFVHCMRELGFSMHLKQPPTTTRENFKRHIDVTWDVGITADALWEVLHKKSIDTVVLGTNDAVFTPLVRKLNDLGITVVVFGCNVNKALAELATHVLEISTTHLLK